MRKMFLALTASGLALAAAWPETALARDAALVVVQADYDSLPDPEGAREAVDMSNALEASGFLVTSSLDQDSDGVREAVEDFFDDAEDADRLLVYLSGHFVNGPRDSYLLTHEADEPSTLSVLGDSLALGPILDVLATKPGQAVLVTAPSGDEVAGTGLADGLNFEAPQGVTLVSGPPSRVVRDVEEGVLTPGLPIGRGLDRLRRGVSVSGFVSDMLPFLPAEGDTLTPAPMSTDDAFWIVAQELDTVAGYTLYLDNVENGDFETEAVLALKALNDTAASQDEATEEGLNLDREARRQVQRDLSILGHNPKGIDGIFGPATRAALTSWQRANGYEASGYLTALQQSALRSAAEARAAQLEVEARARQAEEERRDRAYWEQIGRGQDEAGLRAYIERYPDGLFSDVAGDRLDEIERQKMARAERAEREYWDSVRAADDEGAYREYLNRYPNGTFAELAKARLAELNVEDDGSAERDAARAEEANVAGNPVTRLLVETRLSIIGFDPGQVDGNFDRQSRRAIRQFQRAQGLPVTGFVTQDTMVRLLAS